MPVSKDTLLRMVRAPEAEPASRVIGIDDWAWKRGHCYGSIVCDLERREIIDVLPDREAATVREEMKALRSHAMEMEKMGERSLVVVYYSGHGTVAEQLTSAVMTDGVPLGVEGMVRRLATNGAAARNFCAKFSSSEWRTPT